MAGEDNIVFWLIRIELTAIAKVKPIDWRQVD